MLFMWESLIALKFEGSRFFGDDFSQVFCFLFNFFRSALRLTLCCLLQAAGAGESWNHIYTQPQPGSSCDAAVHVYNQQTFLHTFLSQKSKCTRVAGTTHRDGRSLSWTCCTNETSAFAARWFHPEGRHLLNLSSSHLRRATLKTHYL